MSLRGTVRDLIVSEIVRFKVHVSYVVRIRPCRMSQPANGWKAAKPRATRRRQQDRTKEVAGDSTARSRTAGDITLRNQHVGEGHGRATPLKRRVEAPPVSTPRRNTFQTEHEMSLRQLFLEEQRMRQQWAEQRARQRQEAQQARERLGIAEQRTRGPSKRSVGHGNDTAGQKTNRQHLNSQTVRSDVHQLTAMLKRPSSSAKLNVAGVAELRAYSDLAFGAGRRQQGEQGGVPRPKRSVSGNDTNRSVRPASGGDTNRSARAKPAAGSRQSRALRQRRSGMGPGSDAALLSRPDPIKLALAGLHPDGTWAHQPREKAPSGAPTSPFDAMLHRLWSGAWAAGDDNGAEEAISPAASDRAAEGSRLRCQPKKGVPDGRARDYNFAARSECRASISSGSLFAGQTHLTKYATASLRRLDDGQNESAATVHRQRREEEMRAAAVMGRNAWDASTRRYVPSSLKGLRPVTSEPWARDAKRFCDKYEPALDVRSLHPGLEHTPRHVNLIAHGRRRYRMDLAAQAEDLAHVTGLNVEPLTSMKKHSLMPAETGAIGPRSRRSSVASRSESAALAGGSPDTTVGSGYAQEGVSKAHTRGRWARDARLGLDLSVLEQRQQHNQLFAFNKIALRDD
jgi:hypothetical protein